MEQVRVKFDLSVGIRGYVTPKQLERVVFGLVSREKWKVDWSKWSDELVKSLKDQEAMKI